MSHVTFENVTKSYGGVAALRRLDLEIQEGEFLTLLGPSGCGKTTTLRLVAGFIQPSEGTIYLGEEDVTERPPQKRQIGMVFQDYALFPHMTVGENIAFGLVERGLDRQRIRRRIGDLLDLVKLPQVADRYPAELSGGQQQRIAVARAVAYPPKVLLMDEPLGALDLKLREAMQHELRRIQQELKITTIYVTHDQTEAMNMSDRIAVMNSGVLEQVGTASNIYNAPTSRFVADFVGQINFLEGEIISQENDWSIVATSDGRLRVWNEDPDRKAGPVTVAVRPEALSILPAGSGTDGLNAISGRVVAKNFLGNLMKISVDVGLHSPVVTEGRPSDSCCETGDSVILAWRPEDAILLTR